MRRTVAVGLQNFGKIRENQIFYIDKTRFIKEWWEAKDEVTLIARPRRFGKTLTMSMVEQFFSVDYAENKFFEDTEIWKDKKYRDLAGTYPVIFLSFADVKETSFEQACRMIAQSIVDLYNKYSFLAEGDILSEREREYFYSVSPYMEKHELSIALRRLSDYLFKYYGRKVILLLDEYDTPMQEAYVHGYWKELTEFTRSLFNATFKSNPYLERGIMTGITRVSKESIFSDLNNLKVVTATSTIYSDIFGFTEKEVFDALDEYGMSEKKAEVKRWYDGFTFGNTTDIYNPWSVINYLAEKRTGLYWANTSSNGLVGELIRRGNIQVKETFERLISGKSIVTEIDEQIVYNQLDLDENAVWSLLLASGYLNVKGRRVEENPYGEWRELYELEITNFEVKVMFRSMIRGWFATASSSYNYFIKALLQDDVRAMNRYINRIALATFSFFDSGSRPSQESEPERFYHGFVLGLIVDLEDQYIITSNRESGFGRYDVMMEPRDKKRPAVIMEFKVFDPDEEKELSDTVDSALRQIEAKRYDTVLAERGISEENIRKYGFAFRGKEVLIGK